MNKDETLALWAQGKDAWNDWAQAMLDRRRDMEKAGTWAVNPRGTEIILPDHSRGNPETEAWFRDAKADFTRHVFEEDANFVAWLFPDTGFFHETTFKGSAWFNSAKFNGMAWFHKANFNGMAWFGSAEFNERAQFSEAEFREKSMFGNAEFGETAEFYEATFSGDASFLTATFSDFASFISVEFGGDALFSKATFTDVAMFTGATFTKAAAFDSATFSDFARFENATFRGAADFSQARFSGLTTFAKAAFDSAAHFEATQAERGFTLAEARFADVPDFTQAHFSEAPRLDDMQVGSRSADRRSLPARFRALKRLAVQGHDHGRERDFFAGELKALRGNPDRLLPNLLNRFRKGPDGKRPAVWPGGGRYWFGLFYQVFSDFGRSIGRPLTVWLGLTFVVCFPFYFCAHFVRAAEEGRDYGVSAGGWLWARLMAGLSSAAPAPPPLACIAGVGEPVNLALLLSIRKGLPFAGVASSEKLNQIHACLYGIHGGGPPESPVIPDAVDFLGIAQLLVSLVLIFLLLLAVRNHFRIG
jgi:uncharacterized protein YjbI with pentapeptide repeats